MFAGESMLVIFICYFRFVWLIVDRDELQAGLSIQQKEGLFSRDLFVFVGFFCFVFAHW